MLPLARIELERRKGDPEKTSEALKPLVEMTRWPAKGELIMGGREVPLEEWRWNVMEAPVREAEDRPPLAEDRREGAPVVEAESMARLRVPLEEMRAK